MKNKNYITEKTIDSNLLEAKLSDHTCGGVVTFVGKVRNHHQGKKVTGLSYEAYTPMAEKVFDQIIKEAKEKFGVEEVQIVHRVGDLKIGDVAVWVGVQSGHRGEAFAACQYTIDELKKRAPIWKKEHYESDKSRWVSCSHDEKQKKTPKTAVILAGGQSKRFGRNKLLEKIGGQSLIEILIQNLKAADFEIVISGPQDIYEPLGYPIVEDDTPFAGPLCALESIWKKINADKILLVAGDMPFITPEVIAALWKESEDQNVTLLEGEKGVSPLPGVYSRPTQYEITRCIKGEKRDLKSLLNRPLKTSIIPLNTLHALDPEKMSLTNINTQEDFEKKSAL